MSIIAFLFLLAPVVMLGLKLSALKDNKPVVYGAIGTSFVAGKRHFMFGIVNIYPIEFIKVEYIGIFKVFSKD
jgi:hypothetical protein